MFRIVEVQGVECFGSRWQAGQESDWWTRAYAGQIPFSDLAGSISRILAYDLFVSNVDRHLNNYFVFKQHMKYSVLAMDFSRAWLFSGMPPPDLPMSDSENTINDLRVLLGLFGNFIDMGEVDDVGDRLANVSLQEISSFIGVLYTSLTHTA